MCNSVKLIADKIALDFQIKYKRQRWHLELDYRIPFMQIPISYFMYIIDFRV